MMNTIYIQLFLILISINAFNQNTSAKTDLLKPIKTKSAVIIDGNLNEPVWQKTTFTKALYDENGQYNNTAACFAYDADHLYAGFICKVNRTSELNSKRLDKDNKFMLSNDWVTFCVDTYHDGINAYAFLTDAAGNKLDGALNPPTRDLSFSFSSKWTSAVQRNQDGYMVEMKIPLEGLPVRWNTDSVTMALQIIRNDKQNNRMVQWAPTKSIGKFQAIVLYGI